ncbi:uncharacterized protein DUF4407 [Anseongella ginsenosidimutans]|uniref:Uncharacterized protein DUF4407 n=1 Tax=Anseongella ginsenosidimutans TaxID=496056 RepID=A0A4R3KQH0_9SPHI|nr:DUF4407 domain-containing protein [Anseongella ginsenosidimutans]QEC52272.1 DUF4407 domain-containing protein [Anseongella ginsenosidimutans]TCS86827.1 uncharacterized protein DUF4407 [Anseongella ginsenosidimutans]
MKKISRFFWFCAGANIPLLDKHPTEHNKYFSIGATVVFTALFAALAGGYALYFVFSGSPGAVLLVIFFGILWGLAIFNLDCYIVSSISKQDTAWKQFLQASPRIILAVLIAIVIARPLELKIFDKEIRAELKEQFLADAKARIDTVNKSFDKKYALESGRAAALKAEGDSLYKEINELRYVLNQEFFGEKTSQTSGIQGYGPYSKKKEEVIRQKEERLAYLRNEYARADSFILVRKKADGLLDQVIPGEATLDSLASLAGFADRNSALSGISELSTGQNDKSTAGAVLFITLLFVAFECMPVFVKLISSKGPYDEEILTRETLRIRELEREREATERIKNRTQETYIDAEAGKQSSIIRSKAIAELELTETAIEAWKNKERKGIAENITDYIRMK